LREGFQAMTQGHFRNEFGPNQAPAVNRNSDSRGVVFGLPLGKFGLLASLLIAFSAGFLAFFLTTFFAILGILFYNSFGQHSMDYSAAYKLIALPVGLAVLIVGLVFLGFLWIRRKTTQK
jgi:hypothetical protein